MHFKELFLASLETRPSIPNNFNPEQLLVNCYDQSLANPDFIHLAAGGLAEFSAPLSYDIRELPCHLLIYTISGSGAVSVSQESVSMSENTLLFIDCRQSFKLNITSPVWKFYIAFVTGNPLFTYHQYFKNASGSLYYTESASGIPSYIRRLCTYSEIQTPADALIISKWFTDILTESCVVSLNQNRATEHIPLYMSDMKKLLDHSYSTGFSLTDFEEKFGVSKYRLCREFSHYYQVSPLQYLNARRIDAAKNLLLTTDMPVHEIGSAVGIDNTNHFINLFKKFTGTTPFAFKQAAPASIRELHSPYIPDVPLQ